MIWPARSGRDALLLSFITIIAIGGLLAMQIINGVISSERSGVFSVLFLQFIGSFEWRYQNSLVNLSAGMV